MAYIGNQPAAAFAGNVFVNQFSGNGVTTQFALNDIPISVEHVDLFIGGVYQNKNTYSVNGNILTCSEAPISGTNNIEIKVFEVLPIGSFVTPGILSAANISFNPSGTILTSTNVQDVIIELLNLFGLSNNDINDYGYVVDEVTFSDDYGLVTELVTFSDDYGFVDITMNENDDYDYGALTDVVTSIYDYGSLSSSVVSIDDNGILA